jgi:O-antigen/teichoic acid export membrane protein
MISEVFRARFGRAVATLTIGSVAAQAVGYLCAPFLTRLYSAEDFGLAGVYTSLAAILAQGVNGKFELAIGLPREETEARGAVLLALGASIGTCLIVGLLVVCFQHRICEALNLYALQEWLVLLPGTLFLMGLQQALQYHLTRMGWFSVLSAGQWTQALGTSLGRISLGALQWGASGLVVGTVIGLTWNSATLLAALWRRRWVTLTGSLPTGRQLAATARRFAEFPLYAAPSSMLNLLGSSLPLLVINRYHSSTDAGHFNLAALVIGVPCSVFAGAIGQALFHRAAEERRAGRSVRALVRRLVITLAGLAFCPLVLVATFGPSLFATVFGPAWRPAGEYARVIAIAFAAQLIVSPLSMLFPVLGAVRLGSLWKFCFFCTTLLTAVAAGRRALSLYLTLFAVHDVALYFFQFYLVRRSLDAAEAPC